MTRIKRLPLLLAAALATAILPFRPAHAGIILAVGDPEDNGVMAADGALVDFAPTSDSPAHANAGNGHSSLHTFGSYISFSFEVSGTAVASTGFGPSDITFGGIPILIEGTSGEAAGAPVILTLQAAGNVPPNPGFGSTELFVNQTLYSVNQSSTITGFSVNDQFYFWGGLLGDGNGDYTMTVTLSVQAAFGLGSAVPEPSSLPLMSAGLVTMLLAWIRWRREPGRKQRLR